MRFSILFHSIAAAITLTALLADSAYSQPLLNSKHADSVDRFYQLDSWLPTPNTYRTASGAPGQDYWQQRADYSINATLDDQNQRIDGEVHVRYFNRSPHELRYIWFQLDQNYFQPQSDAVLAAEAPSFGSRASFELLQSIVARSTFEGGFEIKHVTDRDGNSVPYTIARTMMRVDLAEPLAPGANTSLNVGYGFKVNDATVIRARCGYEYFKKDNNRIYEVAQWYPRVVAYTDYTGWQHKQFLGAGEFTLELGHFDVSLTVPADMVVAATGELKNAAEVLKPEWIERLAVAREANKPMYVITPEEATENEKSRVKTTKTWFFRAENVRDFAFAASRKFIWDAMGVEVERVDLGKFAEPKPQATSSLELIKPDAETPAKEEESAADTTPKTNRVLAMSYYPNEANPLWFQYSTESIAHTIEVYGKFAFPYPYPVAISVNGPVYGMEYPMICFNGPRPEDDGTYTKATKYGLISVVIHEVGHNYFPMIVNSDERQWTWMDEGINTFLQYLAEQAWEDDYPSRRGEPEKIVPFMQGGHQRPIMTGSEEILQFGNNGYAKPATALNILRETILGRELFDFAFREYARRWRFKRPTPADFFRTMEDASGEDLDWFWRGWFYSTDHVDIAIDNVRLFKIDSGDPDESAERKRQERDKQEKSLSDERNKMLPKRINLQPGLKDFYNTEYDEFNVEEDDRKSYRKFIDGLDTDERSLLRRATNFYVVTFKNVGGLVMPIIVRLHYTDGSSELVSIPAQIWRHDGRSVNKLFMTDKELLRVELDPKRQTADVERSNNHWPPKLEPSRFKLFKDETPKNPMQKAKVEKTEKEPKEDKETVSDGKADAKVEE